MERLVIAPTDNTPAVTFDHLTGKFEISGKSFPDSAWDFYEPVFQWLDEYIMVPLESTELSLKFDYVDSGSIKCMLEIVNKLAGTEKDTHSLMTIWYHDPGDDEMKEIGENINEVLGRRISVKPSTEQPLER